jgi:hypothetical protein
MDATSFYSKRGDASKLSHWVAVFTSGIVILAAYFTAFAGFPLKFALSPSELQDLDPRVRDALSFHLVLAVRHGEAADLVSD